ncbi:BC1881 family protein [Aeribacillus composti]|uniref:BC1881 family protein n=1 Tax=Aeribacillus composti TaxID=1868734 RepID=UPI00406A3FEF
MARNNREAVDLTYKINIDANDAIKALKAIQREAREATKALRELEKYYSTRMSEIPTEVLTGELLKREGIKCYDVAAHEERAKITIHGPREGSTYFVDGPAKIIVNCD